MNRTCLYQIQLGGEVQCAHGRCEHFEKPVTKSLCDGCDKRLAPSDIAPVEPTLSKDQEALDDLPATFMGKVAQAAKVIAGSVVEGGGNPLVSRDVVKARRATCDGCPFRTGRACSVCSCNIYAKALFTLSRCPKAKWKE